jgi:hypothetical protein
MAWKKGHKKPPQQTEAAKSGEKDVSQSQQKVPVSNYWRIVSYGTRIEHLLMFAALVASATSGVTMPLMNIVFGNLVGQFNTFGNPDSSTTESDFRNEVDRFSLIIFGLFLAKFVLCYVSMVSLMPACYYCCANLLILPSFVSALSAYAYQRLCVCPTCVLFSVNQSRNLTKCPPAQYPTLLPHPLEPFK